MQVSPFEWMVRRDRWRVFSLLAIPALLVALALDLPAYHLLSAKTDAGRGSIEQVQLYQFLRVAGYLPAWLAISVGADLARRRRMRVGGNGAGGWMTPGILVGTLATGLAVVLLKALIGRYRPLRHEGGWFFKPVFSGFWDGSNLSTPSSHAAIAFAGALVVSRLRPGTGVIAIPIAIGCAGTRVIMGHHFLSDVVLSAIVAWAVVELILPGRRAP